MKPAIPRLDKNAPNRVARCPKFSAPPPPPPQTAAAGRWRAQRCTGAAARPRRSEQMPRRLKESISCTGFACEEQACVKLRKPKHLSTQTSHHTRTPPLPTSALCLGPWNWRPWRSGPRARLVGPGPANAAPGTSRGLRTRRPCSSTTPGGYAPRSSPQVQASTKNTWHLPRIVNHTAGASKQ